MMMALLSLSLALAGLAGIAAAMPKHQRGLFGNTPSARLTAALALGGWLLLAASLATALFAWPPAIALAGWTGFLTGAIFIVALFLTYRPKALLPASLAVLIVGLFGWAVPALPSMA